MTSPEIPPTGPQEEGAPRADTPTTPEERPPQQAYPPPTAEPTLGYQSYQSPYQPQQSPRSPARGWSRMAPWVAVIVAVILLLVGGGVGFAIAQANRASTLTPGASTLTLPPAAQDFQQQMINVINVTQPSVVEVLSRGAQGAGVGSGEIISSDGYIVTNDHVVAGFSQYGVLLSNGKSYTAQLVGESPQDDLAVLKIDATGLRPITFGDSSKAQVGQFVIAIGSPLGLAQSATQGIVSALNRTASEAPQGPAGTLTGLIQTSAAINPGNSGGALVDLTGQLIGVPTLGVVDPNSGGSANGIGFAIPSNRVKYVADQLIQYGKLQNSGQGFIGIQGIDVTPQVAAAYNLSVQSGVLIVGFTADANGSSPAQQAGLQTGDIITAVDGQTITGNGDLASALLTKQPGTKVTITYVRGSQTNTVSVTLGERPA